MIDALKSGWTRLRANRWRALAVDALLILAFFQAFAAWQKQDMLGGSQPEAPTLALPDLEGNWVELRPGNTRRTLVYFLAPWCTVCKHSVPHLNTLRRLRDPEELAIHVVGLAWQDPEELRRFARDTGLELPILTGVRSTAEAWKIRAFPTYYVLDENGQVLSSDLGLTTEWGLRWRTWAWQTTGGERS